MLNKLATLNNWQKKPTITSKMKGKVFLKYLCSTQIPKTYGPKSNPVDYVRKKVVIDKK